jgi:regulator of RNase E activity RraA
MRQPLLTMPSSSVPLPAPLDAIRQFDTCTIANAIERFGVRLRNEGYTRPGLECLTGGFTSVIGYAATFSVRSADPPMRGRAFPDRTDWWESIQQVPTPRIAVFQDLDPADGGSSIVGAVHAAILKAFQCLGVITNGAVRDLPEVAAMQFPMFAPSAAVSHGYTHIVEYGCPIEILGLRVCAGDLLYADCHGVISIPREIATEVPAVAARIRAHERRIIDLCQSPEFSPEKLTEAVRSKD